jgi:hypothetical protein
VAYFWEASTAFRQAIKPFEALGWSWSFGRAWKPAISAFVSGPIIALIIWIIGPALGLPVRLLHNMLLMGVGAGLILAIITGLLTGMVSFKIKRETAFPNQGIWQSAKRAGISTLITLLIILSISVQSRDFLPFSAFLGCIALYTGGLTCAQHFTTRFMLWQIQVCPWNYSQFLNFVSERMLLQEVGGGYQFIHDFLKKHLEKLSQTAPQTSIKFQKTFISKKI